MNTIYKILIGLIALSFIGCENDSNDDKDQKRDQLELSVSSSAIELDENKPDEDVLTFSWNDATEIGDGYSFSYIFRLDIADNDFETAIDPIVAEDGVHSISFTTEQLYDYIVEKWHGVAGQETWIEARIVAKVEGPKFLYPEIATTKVAVKTYLPKSVPLYMVGSATDAGMDPNQAIILNEISNGKVYSWKGNLKQGDYKFIFSTSSMLPSLNKGENETTMVLRENESDPDNYFKIETAGLYFIYLSKRTMEISTTKIVYENIYLVGNATAAEWDIDKAIPMVMDPLNPSIFTVQTTLKEGELKMPTQRDWGSPTFRPINANDPITSEVDTKVVSAADGANDTKWTVSASQAGTYKITLDTENKKIYFVKQ